jgi:hypothetical protein
MVHMKKKQTNKHVEMEHNQAFTNSDISFTTFFNSHNPATTKHIKSNGNHQHGYQIDTGQTKHNVRKKGN